MFESLKHWFESLKEDSKLFDVRAEIMPLGDCNLDGNIDADDLPCISTVDQRDAILDALDPLPGDFNGDGDVDFEDFIVLSQNYQSEKTAYIDGNVDVMGAIDFTDFIAFSNNFGKTVAAASVPEPHGLALGILTLVIVAQVRRQRPKSQTA